MSITNIGLRPPPGKNAQLQAIFQQQIRTSGFQRPLPQSRMSQASNTIEAKKPESRRAVSMMDIHHEYASQPLPPLKVTASPDKVNNKPMSIERPPASTYQRRFKVQKSRFYGEFNPITNKVWLKQKDETPRSPSIQDPPQSCSI